MTTIYVDDLFRVPALPRRAKVRLRAARDSVRPQPVAAPSEPVRPLRREDFEARSSGLGDLLGGQVFPRHF